MIAGVCRCTLFEISREGGNAEMEKCGIWLSYFNIPFLFVKLLTLTVYFSST